MASKILFIHGYPLNENMWASQVEALGASALTYDQRGFGQHAVSDPQYMFESYVDDLFAYLDKHHLKQVTLAGFSMGGYVALRALERSPERFSGLILIDTQSAADSDTAKLGRVKALSVLKTDGLAKVAQDFLKGALSARSFENASLKEKLLSMVKENKDSGVASALIALATRTDTTESLRKIQIPTLILVGEEDKITPVATAQAMQEKISGSTLKVISKSGHLSPLENPDEVNQAILEFRQKNHL